MPNILLDYRIHDSETNRLLGLCGTLGNLDPAHQKLVAEIVLLRLFSLFENFISSVCIKLVCGASYADGTSPNLIIGAHSSQSARQLLKTYGRTRHRYTLTWSKASEIKENLKYVIDANDNVVNVVDRNGVIIDEVRRVRNRIAHNNEQSRRFYREIVRRHYGGYLNHITPGTLLLTPRIVPLLLEQYIKKQRIVIKDVVKA